MPAETLSRSRFESDESFTTAQELGLDFSKEPFGLEEFRMGMDMELVHGRCDLVTDVTHSDPVLTGKLVLAHLRKRPDYYTRLAEAKNGCPSWLELGATDAWAIRVVLDMHEGPRMVPFSQEEEDCHKRMEHTIEDAERAASVLGVDFSQEGFEPEDLRLAMTVELEHGCCHPETNITNCDPVLTAKLAIAHLRERADFYEHLVEVEGNLPR